MPPTFGSFFLYKVQYLSRTYLPSSSSSAYFYIFSILSAVDWSRGGADKLVLDSMDFKKSSIGCCFRPESDYPEALLVVCLYALNTDLAIGSVIFFKKLSSALLNAILVYFLIIINMGYNSSDLPTYIQMGKRIFEAMIFRVDLGD